MTTLDSKKLPAKLDNLETFIDMVSACAVNVGFTPDKVSSINVAAEEVLVNVFNYAYGGLDGDVEVNCLVDNSEMFIVEIVDSGISFNILSAEEPDITLGLEDRYIGGLGILMIKNLMDDVKYHRNNDKNILQLICLKKS
ncbi:MAG: ATP-binding protein [Nitrospirae bacterium]|nr:ATP-binding protein [Nitrospirota bacterium]